MNKTQFEAAILEAVRADPHNGAKWKPLEELFASEGERGSGALSNALAERKTRVRQLITRRQHPTFSTDDYSRYGVFVLDRDHATKQKRDPQYLDAYVVRDLEDERPALPPEVCLESVIVLRHDTGHRLVPLALLRWGDSGLTHRYQEWYPNLRVLDKTVVVPQPRPTEGSGHAPNDGLDAVTRLLDPRLRAELLKVHSEMSQAEEFRSPAELETFYQRFRSRFGSEALLAREGEELLELMHGHPEDGQSLMYWLEFKNDDEFPAVFGGIAGGSSLKFGVYKRKEGGWAIAGPDGNPKEIPVAEAVAIARRHRAQMIEGSTVLASLTPQSTQDDYLRAELALGTVAPDVADTVWGHKYFHLLFPRLLDDFHATNYQHYHLLRLLQPRPSTEGRYSSAWRYVAIARELGIPLDQLTKTLLRRDGPPRSYWRIGTSDGTEARNRWDLMRDGNVVAVGWENVGDLSAIADAPRARETIRALMAEHYPKVENVVSRKAGELASFLTRMKVGDVVCASDGGTLLGVGRVTGPYKYTKGEAFPHRRSVEWLALGEWKLMTGEGTRTTVWRLNEYDSLLAVERILLDAAGGPAGEPESNFGPEPVAASLTGVERRVTEVLERKGQVILYGPPGTGKTYWALQTARDFIALRLFHKLYHALSKPEKHVVDGDPSGVGAHIRVCTFHPEYGYENFIEGYQPTTVEGRLTYVQHNGIFKQLCEDARRDHDRPFLLVIDEINRGDIARIFGELLTLLERDKRGRSVRLPLSGKPFSVPENVFVIGTMNTADRSIALLDVALRRRFGFVALMPDYALLGATTIAGLPLAPWLRWVNGQIRQVVGSDGRHREIGHGYLWDGSGPVKDPAVLAAILRDDVVPLLEEYCFEDLEQLEQILGEVIVDMDNQRVRYEVFDGDIGAVAAALLAVSPELSKSEMLGDDDPSALTADEEVDD